MKLAYSILLGDYVTAEEAGYEDCAEFEIVCPCCDEKVHKHARALTDGRESHYFAHFKAVTPEQREFCELRVASITPEQVAAKRSEARGQALEKLLAVFRDALVAGVSETHAKYVPLLPTVEDYERDLRHSAYQVMRAPGFKLHWKLTFLPAMRRHVESDLTKKWMDGLTGIMSEKNVEKSRLANSRTAEYVRDALKHLVTPQGQANLQFAFALALCETHASMIRIHARFQGEGRASPAHVVPTGQFLYAMRQPTASKFNRMMDELGSTYPEQALLDACAKVHEHVLRSLATIPYIEIAADRLALNTKAILEPETAALGGGARR